MFVFVCVVSGFVLACEAGAWRDGFLLLLYVFPLLFRV
jgi:hypothetical protein